MKNIDFNAQMSAEEFINLTNEVLDAKDKLDEIEDYCGKLKKIDDFVEPEYFSNQNELDFIEPFASKSAKNKKVITFIGNVFALILRVLCLIGFIVFLSKYPVISGEKIDDGGILILPFIFLTVYSILHFLKDKTVNKVLQLVFIPVGLAFPGLCALAAKFAPESTGKGDTACVIAYFILIVPTIYIPFLITHLIARFAIFCADRKLYKSIEYIEGLKVARKLDEKEAERLRKEDEKRYQDYLEKRAEMLPRKKELIASVWGKGYERLYKEWESLVDCARSVFTHAIKYQTDREFIRWCLSHVGLLHRGTISDFIKIAQDIVIEEHERTERSINLAGEVAKEFTDLLSRR